MKKFLVIDDDVTRLESYKKLFDFVEIEYAATTEDVKEKIPECDGYLVDIIYNEPCYSGLTFKVVVDLLSENKPIFIISNKWNEAMDGSKMQCLVQSSKYRHVLGYLSWDKINAGDANEIVKDFIITQYNNYYNLAYEAFGPDQPITVLQLSDIEFGNKQQYEYIETFRSGLISNVRKDLRTLEVKSKKVDFILLCGDIAFTGKKDEYDAALKWLQELGIQLLENKDFTRFIVVPGNHDFDFEATAGNHYKYFQEKIEGEIKKRFKIREKKINTYSEHAFDNFNRFVYELTGDSSLLINPNEPCINRKYENYGLNFVLLNPVRIKENLQFDYKLEDSYVSKIIDIFSNYDSQKVANIVLSHINWDKYSMNDASSDATSAYITKLINDANINAWIYGHAHDTAKIDDVLIGDHKVLVSRSNSVMLDGSGRCEDAQNGYTLLKFCRKDNEIYKVQYLSAKGGIKEKDSPFTHEEE